MEEVVEFKKRFCTIKVKSDFAHLKRIKAIDFFKLFINNSPYERNDDYVLDFIIEKKRNLVKQIELLYKYKKEKFINGYIEEYNKCYNNINIKKKNLENKMQHYINSLTNTKKKLNLGKNMLLKKLTKFQKFLGFNSLYKSKNKETQKNSLNDSLKHKLKSKINFKLKKKLSLSNICLYKRNSKNLENKFKVDSPKSKLSSLSPSTKNETNKLKDDSSIPININKSLSFSSYRLNLSKSTKNYTNLNKNKNKKLYSSSYDISTNEINTSKKQTKSRNNKLKENQINSFDLDEYKKNLYCKYGFLINEMIKFGIGPNIPLRKEMTILNNDINIGKKLNTINKFKNLKKSLSIDKEIRKKRYEFLKITEL